MDKTSREDALRQAAQQWLELRDRAKTAQEKLDEADREAKHAGQLLQMAQHKLKDFVGRNQRRRVVAVKDGYDKVVRAVLVELHDGGEGRQDFITVSTEEVL